MTIHALAVAAALAAAAPAAAQYNRPAPQDAFDPALLRIDESRFLGQTVPDVEVMTESGPVRLHSLIAGRPTILLLAYYTCDGPCPTTIQNMARALRAAGGAGAPGGVGSLQPDAQLASPRPLDGAQHPRHILDGRGTGAVAGVIREQQNRRPVGDKTA